MAKNETQEFSPWQKWYWSDWFGDSEVRLLDIGSRCIWFEILGLMWQSSERGVLLIGGTIPTVKQMSRLIGCTEAEYDSAWLELSRLNIFSIREDGAIFSRRVLRDVEKSKTASNRGKTGGNPKLGYPVGYPPAYPNSEILDNHEDKPHGNGNGNGNSSLNSSLSSPEKNAHDEKGVDSIDTLGEKRISSAQLMESQATGLQKDVDRLCDAGPTVWKAQRKNAQRALLAEFQNSGATIEHLIDQAGYYRIACDKTDRKVSAVYNWLENKQYRDDWKTISEQSDKPKGKQQLVGSSTRPRLTDEECAKLMQEAEIERREIFIRNGLDPDYD